MSSNNEKWDERYYVDFRFIVDKAESHRDAVDQVEALISEATDGVWYTIDKVAKQQKDPKREHSMWQDCYVKLRPLLRGDDDSWI